MMFKLATTGPDVILPPKRIRISRPSRGLAGKVSAYLFSTVGGSTYTTFELSGILEAAPVETVYVSFPDPGDSSFQEDPYLYRNKEEVVLK
jgi:hypothetical protein